MLLLSHPQALLLPGDVEEEAQQSHQVNLQAGDCSCEDVQ